MKAGLFLFVTGLSLVTAHTRLYGIWVNGEFKGDGRNNYIRSPPNDDPVKDAKSAAMTCNVKNTPAKAWVDVKGGDEITVEWYFESRGDMIIDPSHVGPVLAYVAPAANNGSGAVWTKLAHAGYSDGKWAVDQLREAKGMQQAFKLPNVPAGDYLVRAEIIALHEADANYDSNPSRGAQFYPACSQIRVAAGPGAEVALPGGFNPAGGYSTSDPGIYFDVYRSFSSYPVPGPAVFEGGASAGESKVLAASSDDSKDSGSSAGPDYEASDEPDNQSNDDSNDKSDDGSDDNSSDDTENVYTSQVDDSAASWKNSKSGRGNYRSGKGSSSYGSQSGYESNAGRRPSRGRRHIAKRGAQCGGNGYYGPTRCADGTRCKVVNRNYWQCVA